jgi:glycosyltransferase involved in cell wall biosynthesis
VLSATSPTKLVEYLALGRPVVATDHPEQRRVLAESGAGICVPFDEKELAEAILELLAHPEAAEDMGARGRAWVEANRSYSIIADRLDAVYRQLAGLPAARRPPPVMP